MTCAATATKCDCTNPTTSPPTTAAPPPTTAAPTSPPSSPTTPTTSASTGTGNSSSNDSGDSLSKTTIGLIIGGATTFVGGLGTWAAKKCTGDRSSDDDTASKAKVQDATKYEIKCDHIMINNITGNGNMMNQPTHGEANSFSINGNGNTMNQ